MIEKRTISYTLYAVKDEELSVTLAKREAAKKWMLQRAKEIAKEYKHENQLEEAMVEALRGGFLKYIDKDDFEKCIYAVLPDEAPFQIVEEMVKTRFSTAVIKALSKLMEKEMGDCK